MNLGPETLGFDGKRTGTRHVAAPPGRLHVSLGTVAVNVDVAALAAELVGLATAHPEIGGTLRLAAGTLDAQKEVTDLKAMVLSVKSALAEHLKKMKAHLKTASNLAEDTALSSQEYEVNQLLRGLVLELVMSRWKIVKSTPRPRPAAPTSILPFPHLPLQTSRCSPTGPGPNRTKSWRTSRSLCACRS